MITLYIVIVRLCVLDIFQWTPEFALRPVTIIRLEVSLQRIHYIMVKRAQSLCIENEQAFEKGAWNFGLSSVAWDHHLGRSILLLELF